MEETLSQSKSEILRGTRALSKSDFRDVFQTIYRNGYFTNHGPLAKEFEALLEDRLDAKHVVAVGNDSLALLIAMANLEIEGTLILPVFQSGLAFQVSRWLNLRTVFCDVSLKSHQPTISQIESVFTAESDAVVLIETWGNRCDQKLITQLANRGLKVLVIAFDSLGSKTDGRYVSNHPLATTVLSFGAKKIVSTLEGGAIVASSDLLADKLRSTRSSYGVRNKIDVKATCNGRFSEFQAGIGIKSFGYLEDAIAHNHNLSRIYQRAIDAVPDLQSFDFEQTDSGNHQCFPVEVAKSCCLSRDQWISRLGITPSKNNVSDSHAFPNAQLLSEQTFHIPTGPAISLQFAADLAKRITVDQSR